MKFKEIASRLTGISCPVFGVSWKPVEAERETARGIITFLEDRRVLYAHESQEIPQHCVDSVLQMREHLTSQLQAIPATSPLTEHLRAMRAACRKFLTMAQEGDGDIVVYGWRQGHWASWRFHAAIGELRGIFGVHVAQIATKYGLDVEEELASILPAEATDDKDGPPRKKLKSPTR